MRNDCERHLNRQGPRAGQDGLTAPPWTIAALAPWIGGLLAASCLISWPWLSGRVTVPWDAKAQFLPQLQFLARSLAAGDSPFWTPNIFAGHPQIADAQSLIFSPPYFLVALLHPAPSAWVMDATLFAFLGASAIAFFLWLTNKSVTPLAAFAGALGFAFGASMAWRIQHTGQVLSLAYLPFVLLFLDKALAQRSIAYGVAAGAFAAFLVLGRDQVGLLCVYFLLAYVAAYWWQGEGRSARFKASLPPLLGAGIAGALIIALPVLMTVLLSQISNRPQIDLEGAGRGSLHPALFLTLLAPDTFGSSGVQKSYWGPPSAAWSGTGLYIAQNMGQLYIGAAAAFALVWGLASGVLLRAPGRFYLAALALIVIYALGWYTPLFSWMHAFVPGVKLYRRPADATFIIGFLSSVLAAFAIDSYLKGQDSRRGGVTAATVILAGSFAAMIGLAHHFGRLTDALPYILLPAALLALSAALLLALARASPRKRPVLTACLAALVACDLAYSNGPGGATALPPQDFEVLEPASANDTLSLLKQRTQAHASDTRRDRVEIVGFGFHWPNISLTHGLENTLGYNPVRLSWTTRALGANDTTGLPGQKSFSALYPSYASPLADLLGIATIATSVPVEEIDKALKPGDLTLIARTREGYVYDNPRALPRVLFAPDAAAADFEALIETGNWPRTDFRQTVLLEDIHPERQGSAPRAPGSIRIISYANTRVELEADSPQGGYAVLNDIWHPWWAAEIDGAPTPLLRANVLFRAVEVPPGRHRVVFTFRPVRGALRQIGLAQTP